jgi:adenine-specific DNA-methyltransferase
VIEGPPPGTYWRVSKVKFDELNKDNRIWWGEDGNNVPAIKRFLSEVKAGRVPQTLWTYQEVGHTQESKKELIALVDFPNSEVVFDTPKPTRLIRRILQLATTTDDNDIVVDFFAGTGSTMDAIFRENGTNGGNRRCILVQLPEPISDKTGSLQTIADITKERLRRAGQKIKSDNPLFHGDVGFRVFKLDSSNIRAWDPDRDNLQQSLLDSIDHIKPGRTEADLLYELLLKLGLDLCVPIEQRGIAGKTVHAIGGGVLLACLAAKIGRDEVELLALGIINWRKELAPVGDSTCVFRDSAFSDDVAKTNLEAILHQHGLCNVRSL